MKLLMKLNKDEHRFWLKYLSFFAIVIHLTYFFKISIFVLTVYSFIHSLIQFYSISPFVFKDAIFPSRKFWDMFTVIVMVHTSKVIC